MNIDKASKRQEERGMALTLVVVITLIMAGMAFAYMGMSFFQGKATADGVQREQALQIAEAGIAAALLELNSGRDLDGNAIGNAEGSLAGGSYQVSVSPSFTAPGEYTLTALGIRSESRRRIEVVVAAGATGLFPLGLFGAEGITASGSVFMDSYSSKNGTYASQATNVNPETGAKYANANGRMGTNGNISVSGNLSAFGDARPGPGGELKVSGKSYYVSGSTENSTSTTSPPIPAYNPPIASAGDLTLKSKQTLTLSSGTYRYDQLSMGSQTVLTFDGEVTLYIDGKVDVGGQATIRLTPTAKVTIFHGSGDFSLGGTGVVNASQIPGNFIIRSATTGTFSYTGTSDFYGAVYAPSAEFKQSGNSAFFGAFVARRVTKLTGDAIFHYDEALGLTGAPGNHRVRSWRELAPN
jgi:hypothetical protein